MSPGPARKMEAGPALGCPTLVAIICVPGLRAMATMGWRMLPGFTRPQALTTSRWAGQSSASCSRLQRREHSPEEGRSLLRSSRATEGTIIFFANIYDWICDGETMRILVLTGKSRNLFAKPLEDWYVVVKQRTTAQSCTRARVSSGDGPKET